MKKVFLIASLLVVSLLRAQDEVVQSFRPVYSIGVVGSQVDGDTYSGYHKIGYFVGLGVNRQLSKRFEMELMLTALQKGARKNYATDSASLNNPNNQFFLMRLDYVEVPLSLKYRYKKFKIEAGAAFAYLIHYSAQTQIGFNPDKQIKSFDYSYFIGGGYKLGANWFLNLRFEYSIVPFSPYYASSAGIYHGQFPYKYFNLGMYNNLLILSLNYKLPLKADGQAPNGK
jgi:opacity protein-like surface antigen